MKKADCTSIAVRNPRTGRKKTSVLFLIVTLLLIAAFAAGCVSSRGIDGSETGTQKETKDVQNSSETNTTVDPETTGQVNPRESISPADALDRLFASGDISISLNTADGGAFNAYSADAWYCDRFKILLGDSVLAEQENPTTESSEYWMTAVSADGDKTMIFWAGADEDMVQYTEGDCICYWSAKPADQYSLTIAKAIRWEYDNLDENYSRIAFALDGKAEEAADYFVHTAYADHMLNLAQGSQYGILDYDVVDWDVIEVSDAGDAIVGHYEYAFTPCDFNSPGIWAGNTREGTGAYEGRLTERMEFVLQIQEDGLWHCIGLGTGGCHLP